MTLEMSNEAVLKVSFVNSASFTIPPDFIPRPGPDRRYTSTGWCTVADALVVDAENKGI